MGKRIEEASSIHFHSSLKHEQEGNREREEQEGSFNRPLCEWMICGFNSAYKRDGEVKGR